MANENNINMGGKITCNRNILLSIITLAAKEISGVSTLVDGFWAKVSKPFCKNTSKGIRIKFDNRGGLIADVYAKIYYGYSVPDIAFRVQENIKNNIASMMDMKAAKINVHILGVDFTKLEAV